VGATSEKVGDAGGGESSASQGDAAPGRDASTWGVRQKKGAR